MDPNDSLLLFANQMPEVQLAVLVIAYLVGFVTAGAGVFYAATGGGRGSMHGHGLGYGVSMMLGGVAIMNLAPVMSAFALTLYGAPVLGDDSPLSRISGEGMEAWVRAIFQILIVIGWIFSLMGIQNLAHAGSRRQKGMLAGLSRIVAGVLLANPYVVAAMLGATFGISDVVQIIVPPPP